MTRSALGTAEVCASSALAGALSQGCWRLFPVGETSEDPGLALDAYPTALLRRVEALGAGLLRPLAPGAALCWKQL